MLETLNQIIEKIVYFYNVAAKAVVYFVVETEGIAISVLIISFFHFFLIRKRKRLSEVYLDISNYLILMVIAIVCVNTFDILIPFYKYRLFNMEFSFIGVVGGFILCDLVYYLAHRFEHSYEVLWKSHQVHHSSVDLSWSTGLRLSWIFFFTSPFYYLPLLLMGFHPVVVLFSKKFILLYQFFMHTPMAKKDNWLGYIIVTPQCHNLHHLANPKFHNKNFGGFLSIWDRMFGTYANYEEGIVMEYGNGEGIKYKNAISLQTMPLINHFKAWRARRAQD